MIITSNLAAREYPEVVLNGMDWYVGSSPWASSYFKASGNGKWAVTIERAGRYEFECRHFPREADKAMAASHTKIQIGEVVKEQEADVGARFVRFELELKRGEYDLQTGLSSGK